MGFIHKFGDARMPPILRGNCSHRRKGIVPIGIEAVEGETPPNLYAVDVVYRHQWPLPTSVCSPERWIY